MADYHCHLSCKGLGDSVCGLYAVTGVASRLPAGDRIVFHTGHSNWLKQIIVPENVVLAAEERDIGFDMNQEYDLQLRTSRSRKRWYAEALTKHYGLPTADAARPLVTRVGLLPPDGYFPESYVVLAPFSAWDSRAWPVVQYIKLAHELIKLGWRVIVIGIDEKPLRENFGDTQAQYFWNMPADWVVATLQNAAMVIGNDSGIPHLSGLLGVPTVAVMAQLTPTLVFSHTDVQAVMPTAGCSPCAWQGHRGWVSSCDRIGCAALMSVGFQDVLHRALSILKNSR